MSFYLLTCGVCCAVFAAVTALLSWIAWAPSVRSLSATRFRATPSANRYFWRRLLPTAFGMFAAVGIALPAFLAFEPRDAAETPGITFALLAVTGAAWLALGTFRASRNLLRAHRLSRHFSHQGLPLALRGAPGCAYRIRHTFPLVCLVGIVRPRLFIAGQVLDCLTAAELDAVLSHEAAHARTRDNLRRLLMRAAPALAWPSAARRIEREWEASVEELCDDRADQGIDLASALVKVARLAGSEARIQLPGTSFYRGGPLTRRVTRLLAIDRRVDPDRVGARLRRWLPIGAAAVAAAALLPSSWSGAYRALELLVHLF